MDRPPEVTERERQALTDMRRHLVEARQAAIGWLYLRPGDGALWGVAQCAHQGLMMLDAFENPPPGMPPGMGGPWGM